MPAKPLLLVDFDGVIHSYTSPWQGAAIAPDPPVNHAIDFLRDALKSFRVGIYSSRSSQPGGINCMKSYILRWSGDHSLVNHLEFPTEKGSAFLTIDDRAIQFDGKFPPITSLLEFKPWNKK